MAGVFSKSYADSSDEDEEAVMEFEERLCAEYLFEQLMGEQKKPNCLKRQRTIKDYVGEFWESQWGQLISNPNVENPRKTEGRRFRRRFRLPFPVFQHLVELCTRENIFKLVNKSPIPIELKILSCLRILGRDNCADDITELTQQILGESTVNFIFKAFVEGMELLVYPKVCKFASGKLFQQVLQIYSKLGLPGCVGSMDCTRIKWIMCPQRTRWHHVGKEGFPTMVFLVIVDHKHRVQYCSGFFKGSNNDVQIVQNDPLCLQIQHGSLENIEYELYDEFGAKYKCTGGYLIVDGGFTDNITFQDPDKFRMTRDAVLWGEWVESVRKDVECFFGILKQRFRWLRNGICYHNSETLQAAFRTCCALHNMILLFDMGSGKFDTTWETVNWEHLDPDADDAVDEEEVIPTVECTDTLELLTLSQIPTEAVSSSTSNDVVRFKRNMSKETLKTALQTSFTVQWIKNELKWPRNFTNSQKSYMPLVRATLEMKRALYSAPSNYVTISRKSIGSGLFSRLGYKKGDFIAYFIGKTMTQEEWNVLCAKEPRRRAYGLVSSEHGVILDCYDHYRNGLCIASYANSPVDCVHVHSKKEAIANCQLKVFGRKGETKKFYLQAGIKEQEQQQEDSGKSKDKFFIAPGIELMWDYGDSYVSYDT